MKNKNLCKKAVSLSLLILCLFNFSGCYPLILNGDEEIIDDDDVKAVIDIQTEPYYEQENDDVFYYSFNSI